MKRHFDFEVPQPTLLGCLPWHWQEARKACGVVEYDGPLSFPLLAPERYNFQAPWAHFAALRDSIFSKLIAVALSHVLHFSMFINDGSELIVIDDELANSTLYGFPCSGAAGQKQQRRKDQHFSHLPKPLL